MEVKDGLKGGGEGHGGTSILYFGSGGETVKEDCIGERKLFV